MHAHQEKHAVRVWQTIAKRATRNGEIEQIERARKQKTDNNSLQPCMHTQPHTRHTWYTKDTHDMTITRCYKVKHTSHNTKHHTQPDIDVREKKTPPKQMHHLHRTTNSPRRSLDHLIDNTPHKIHKKALVHEKTRHHHEKRKKSSRKGQ